MIDRQLIMNFSADNAEGYEKFVPYYEAFKAGASTVGTVSFSEADSKMLDFLKGEIAKRAKVTIEDYGGNVMQYSQLTSVREAAFSVVSVLTDLIIPNALIKEFGYIAQIDNIAWGDSLKVELRPRDLFIASKFGRGKRLPEIVRQYKGIKTVVPELRAIAVGVSLYDILTGKYTLAEFVSKATASVETAMRYDIWDNFVTAMGTLASSGDAKLQYTGYTQDDMVALTQIVGAWNNSPAIVMGTKIACSKVLPASTNYRFNLGDEYVKLGHVRDFFGTQVIELEQVADYGTEFKVKLPDNKLFVLSPAAQKIVHVAVEGNTLSNITNPMDAANLIATGSIMKSWGVAAATSAIAGVITLS